MASRRGLLVVEPMFTLGFCSTGERLPVALRTEKHRENLIKNLIVQLSDIHVHVHNHKIIVYMCALNNCDNKKVTKIT